LPADNRPVEGFCGSGVGGHQLVPDKALRLGHDGSPSAYELGGWSAPSGLFSIRRTRGVGIDTIARLDENWRRPRARVRSWARGLEVSLVGLPDRALRPRRLVTAVAASNVPTSGCRNWCSISDDECRKGRSSGG